MSSWDSQSTSGLTYFREVDGFKFTLTFQQIHDERDHNQIAYIQLMAYDKHSEYFLYHEQAYPQDFIKDNEVVLYQLNRSILDKLDTYISYTDTQLMAVLMEIWL